MSLLIPRSFFNSDVNTSPPSLKKDGGSPSNPAGLCLLKKSIALIINIADGGLVYTCIDHADINGKVHWNRKLTRLLHKVFCPARQPALLRLNQYAVESLITWFTRRPWTIIPNQSAFSISLHLPISTAVHSHFLGSRSAYVSGIYVAHYMLHLEGPMSMHLIVQSKSTIFIVPVVYVAISSSA